MKWKLVVLLTIVLALIVVYSGFFHSSDESEVLIVLRYDDYCNTSSVEIESLFLDAIDKYGISCSFGIIPYTNHGKELSALDSGKIALIKDYVLRGDIEIAQHGNAHINRSQSGHKSEFKGLGVLEQEILIKEGKDLIKTAFEVVPISFIPPWNSYDEETLELLKSEGFQILSADNYGPVESENSFSYFPATATLDEIWSQLRSGKIASVKGKSVFILMMHDYDFKEVNQDQGVLSVPQFPQFLAEISEAGWKIRSLRDATDVQDVFDSDRYKLNKRKQLILSRLSVLSKQGVIFNRLQDLNFYYLERSEHHRLFVFFGLVYVFILFFLWMLVSLFIVILKPEIRIVRLIALALIIFAIPAGVFLVAVGHIPGKYEALLILFYVSIILAISDYLLQKRMTSPDFSP